MPAFAEPEIAAPETGGGKGLKLILAAVASIALFVVLFVYPGVMRTSSKPPAPVHQDSSQLQLRVERAAGELLLSWNRDADAIRNASKAVLSITDGDQHENVQMDLAQLANGSIVYSPSGHGHQLQNGSGRQIAEDDGQRIGSHAAHASFAATGADRRCREGGGCRRREQGRRGSDAFHSYPQSERSGGHGTGQAGPGAAEDLPHRIAFAETAPRGVQRPAGCPHRQCGRSLRPVFHPRCQCEYGGASTLRTRTAASRSGGSHSGGSLVHRSRNRSPAARSNRPC